MGSYPGFQKITLKEAFSSINLHAKSDTTFYLGNMIIQINDKGLKITYIGSSKEVFPNQTYYTNSPFRYTYNNLNYLIVNENGKLTVYEEEKIVGS